MVIQKTLTYWSGCQIFEEGFIDPNSPR